MLKQKPVLYQTTDKEFLLQKKLTKAIVSMAILSPLLLQYLVTDQSTNVFLLFQICQ